ncbi:MAG: hypothetical protein Q7S74_01760 [Nanoarchaeota archaeon]|nr:hypothetical protein [Nanoarchaeota archaeon]
MNRKGDISLILLVLVAIVLSVTALFSFASFSNSFKGDSKDRTSIITNLIFSENYGKENLKFLAQQSIVCSTPPEICSLPDVKSRLQTFAQNKADVYEGAKPIFGKVIRGEFDFQSMNSIYKLEIKDISLDAKAGSNEISRQLTICMQFNNKGEYIADC